MEKDEKIELMLELREQEGLNRKEFALKYGIPYPTITDWEMGHRRIPEYFLRLLAYKVGTESIKKGDYETAHAEQEIVETDRFLLRHFMKEDIEGCLEGWGRDKKLGDYILGYPMDIGGMSDFVLNLSSNPNAWLILEKDENKPIGYITFDIPYAQLEVAEVGYVLGEKYQHKGYAREALMKLMKVYFERKGIYMIEAKYNENNSASANLLKMLGFREEARLRDRRKDIKSGKRCNLIITSLTEDEFSKCDN